MIYSEVCVDDSCGFEVQEDGTMKHHKLGRDVLTLEECDRVLHMRFPDMY